ncbi:hypothetical protein ACFW83_28320, partial [Streptomyces anandii]
PAASAGRALTVAPARRPPPRPVAAARHRGPQQPASGGTRRRAAQPSGTRRRTTANPAPTARRRGPEQRGTTPATGSAPVRPAATGTAPGAPVSALDTGWNTTVHRVPARRPGLRTSLRRHSRTTAVIAGTVLFLSALLLGMSLF